VPANSSQPQWERKRGFARVLTELIRRLGIFVTLSFASLDRMSLRSKLDEIGRSSPLSTS
jgi:arsenate reductase